MLSTINGCAEQIERDIPSYLSQVDATTSPASKFFHSSRVRATFQFVRTLIARQALIDEFEANSNAPPAEDDETRSATSEACRLSLDTIKTYSRLRHLGLLRFCGFQAVSHLTAAAHTLIACMLRSSNLAFEHRPDLLTAIDVLLVFSSPFPDVKTIAQLLAQLSRTLDYRHGSSSHSEAVAIRVLARQNLASPNPTQTSAEPPPVSTTAPALSSWFSWDCDLPDPGQPLSKHYMRGAGPSGAHNPHHNDSSILGTAAPPPALSRETSTFATTDDASAWLSLPSPSPIVESQWMPSHNAVNNAMAKVDSAWGNSFSFLNDGLFDNL